MMPEIPHTWTTQAALLCSASPLAAFALILVFLRKRGALAAGVSIAAVTVSYVCAAYLLLSHWHAHGPEQAVWRWMASGDVAVTFGYLLDPLSMLMLVIVSGVALLVQVYSLSYMEHDPGFGRYYAFMSLFAWAMLTMVMAPNLFQLYIFWELVGVASYLLIGFWFEKFSASQAGKKAFVFTRIGDLAFLAGLILLFWQLGNLNILDVNAVGETGRISPCWITLSSVLIFGGVIGKSAQFPLLTWLPDAMEGPTPVSALLHSATMVAAGVFLFARLFPYFSLSPTAMTFFLAIGTISMLLSSTMAMVSRDIKQVWAYSTISQLGYMVMGLAAGGYFAGVFHLTTHAMFKALLFLCAGVFIHAHHTNDMFEIAEGNGRAQKIPMFCMLVGAAALSGVWPFAGFFSKEAILGQLALLDNPVWLSAGLVGAFLTAYYTFRLIFVILFPEDVHDTGHAHPTSIFMAAPLLILAVKSVVLGFYQPVIENFLMGHAAHGAHGGGHEWLMIITVCLTFAAIGLAWYEFGRPGCEKTGFVERFPAVAELFENRWYIDCIYRMLLDKLVYAGIAFVCAENDKRVIDGGIDGFAKGVAASGVRVAGLHVTAIQAKLAFMFAVFFILSFFLIF